ncbi:extensin-like protein [Bacillus thermotolerans]|uniref:Extensin-like protein n=2 Tax=Bacillus thermotolerans TaxID=1221996 RepID=A0A0F5HTE3_BACTR|nr:extensin-like protein [Bacillus thermotolerans]
MDLLESIALEEIALSHVMNAEAEKIQAFVGKCLDFPTHPSNEEIMKFNKSVGGLLETVVMKEWLLLKKLENVLEFEDKTKACTHHPHKNSTCRGHSDGCK